MPMFLTLLCYSKHGGLAQRQRNWLVFRRCWVRFLTRVYWQSWRWKSPGFRRGSRQFCNRADRESWRKLTFKSLNIIFTNFVKRVRMFFYYVLSTVFGLFDPRYSSRYDDVLETGCRSSAEIRNFALLLSVQTVCVPPPPPNLHSSGYGGFFPSRMKWEGREADHSPLSSAQVKNGDVTLPFPHTSSWRGA
jgi:hypothetical protein